MQPYLFIGGPDDALTNPAPDDAETLNWPVGVSGRTTYNRKTLSLDGASIVVYVHESLQPAQVLELLAAFYKAWCLNRLGGRRP